VGIATISSTSTEWTTTAGIDLGRGAIVGIILVSTMGLVQFVATIVHFGIQSSAFAGKPETTYEISGNPGSAIPLRAEYGTNTFQLTIK
jgi:hypothetical protein